MVCFNKMPLAVTVIADRKANTGKLCLFDTEVLTGLEIVEPVLKKKQPNLFLYLTDQNGVT